MRDVQKRPNCVMTALSYLSYTTVAYIETRKYLIRRYDLDVAVV